MLTLAGYDIINEKTGSNSYYFGFRQFQLLEIKILIDAVSFAKHIGVQQSKNLIDKLTSLESIHRADKLYLHINVEEQVKIENNKIYYVIDTICRAIIAKKQIQFQYYAFQLGGRKVLRNDEYCGATEHPRA